MKLRFFLFEKKKVKKVVVDWLRKIKNENNKALKEVEVEVVSLFRIRLM